MLSPGVTSTPAVVALSGGPGASDSHSGARAAASQQEAQQAQQEEAASLAIQSAPVGQPASGPFLLKDGFMQFEGPTYPREDGTLSIQSAEDGSSGGNGDVQVVLAAAGSEPQVLYERASTPDRQAWLHGTWAMQRGQLVSTGDPCMAHRHAWGKASALLIQTLIAIPTVAGKRRWLAHCPPWASPCLASPWSHPSRWISNCVAAGIAQAAASCPVRSLHVHGGWGAVMQWQPQTSPLVHLQPAGRQGSGAVWPCCPRPGPGAAAGTAG